MWGVVVLDGYAWDERQEMAAALEEIASSRDTYGFASGGVYCFWDLATRDVLYIGRAVDLPQRFEAHNGLGRRRTRGTKLERITEYLAAHARIGYSVLVRSPNSQTDTARLRRDLRAEFGERAELFEGPDAVVRSEAELEIAHAEGTALRSTILATGALPSWNDIGGELSVWARDMSRADDTGRMFTGAIDTLLQARSTIRELAADATATQYESVLLNGRVNAVRNAGFDNVELNDYDIMAALDEAAGNQAMPWWVNLKADVDRIKSDKYVLRRPWPMIATPPPADRANRVAWCEGRAMTRPPYAPKLR